MIEQKQIDMPRLTISGPFLSIICLIGFGAFGFGVFIGCIILMLLGLA